MAGIDMTHVPYKGSPPALVDVIAGRVPLMSSTMPPALPQIKIGKVRAIAVTSAKRSPALPDVPTVAESGLPGYEAIAWQGLVAPAGTPKPVISRLNAEFVNALKQPEIVAKLNEQGFDEIFYPGEMEARNDVRNRREGLELPQDTLDDLRRIARETGLESKLPF
jgi:tripartite-type tricarboxylate transporter receptor subunit TctC